MTNDRSYAWFMRNRAYTSYRWVPGAVILWVLWCLFGETAIDWSEGVIDGLLEAWNESHR